MGDYINPPNMTKEEFLKRHGERLTAAPEKHCDAAGRYAVCLIANGWMTAAGIAYSQDELEVFKYNDGRPRIWYYVPGDLLKPYMHLGA